MVYLTNCNVAVLTSYKDPPTNLEELEEKPCFTDVVNLHNVKI